MAAAAPAAMIVSVPDLARGTPPVTGASTKPMPFSARRAPICPASSGPEVEKSTTHDTLRQSMMPPGPVSTASVISLLGRHVSTMSAARPASATLSAQAAPAASSVSALARVRV